MAKYKMHVLVCGGTGCHASESEALLENLKTIMSDKGLDNDVQVIATGCFGFCEKGPIVKIMPDNTFYTQVTPADAREIIEEHIVKGRKVNPALRKPGESGADRRFETYGILQKTTQDCTAQLRFY